MSALKQFSRLAARRYLQSAVFIDDHIFDQKTGMAAIVVEPLPQRKPIFRRAGVENLSRKVETENESDKKPEQPYHPKDLVSSFAREGITCALYQPDEGFSTDPDSEIFKLCERPDIIILDWDFLGDNGAKALDLIAALVKQSAEEFPHHTRLIAVYTSDPSLLGVANQLAARLKKEGLDANPEGAQCRIKSGASQITVLGKPTERFGAEERQFTVKETQLANKLIDEFVGMNSGILPAFALHGLAAIRRNSKRILDRFNGELDGAFLLHRGFIATSEEAFDQLPELLAEEMRAVVEDECLSPGHSKKIAAAALASDHISKKDHDLITLLNSPKPPKKVVEKLSEGGVIPSGHLRLAALFSSRTQYSSSPRKLSFGTVVRHRAKYSKKHSAWQYAVCLMPACDSLRLKQPTRFPFWTVEAEIIKGHGMVLASDKNAPISLSASGKAGEKLWTDSFNVDNKSKTVVAHRVNKTYRYEGSKKTIEWVGQLKPLHAHRIAHAITDGLSRVGVSEAEWLRLACS